MNPYHSPEGIDVKEPSDPENGVQYADARACHKNPSDRDQDARDNDASQGNDADQPGERRVGTMHQPGEEGSEAEGKQSGGQGKVKRVPGCAPKIAAGERPNVVGQRETRFEKSRFARPLDLQTGPNDHQQRNNDMINENQDDERQGEPAAVQRNSPSHL